MSKKFKTAPSIKNTAAEIAGWYGALAIITAYALVSFEVVNSSDVGYQLLNLTGAAGVIVIAVHKRVKQSVVINIFWGLVALAALIRIVAQ